MRVVGLLVLGLLSGCTSDALYTYCTDGVQCGERTYNNGDDDEYEVLLECIEVSVEVEPGRTTRGNHCTISCFGSGDCDSRVGLADGRCITLTGETESFCYQRCDDGVQCYPSSTCETLNLSGGDVRVCLPTRTP